MPRYVKAAVYRLRAEHSNRGGQFQPNPRAQSAGGAIVSTTTPTTGGASALGATTGGAAVQGSTTTYGGATSPVPVPDLPNTNVMASGGAITGGALPAPLPPLVPQGLDHAQLSAMLDSMRIQIESIQRTQDVQAASTAHVMKGMSYLTDTMKQLSTSTTLKAAEKPYEFNNHTDG